MGPVIARQSPTMAAKLGHPCYMWSINNRHHQKKEPTGKSLAAGPWAWQAQHVGTLERWRDTSAFVFAHRAILPVYKPTWRGAGHLGAGKEVMSFAYRRAFSLREMNTAITKQTDLNTKAFTKEKGRECHEEANLLVTVLGLRAAAGG